MCHTVPSAGSCWVWAQSCPVSDDLGQPWADSNWGQCGGGGGGDCCTDGKSTVPTGPRLPASEILAERVFLNI